MVPIVLGLFFIKKNNGSELPMNNNEIISKLTLGKDKIETVTINDVEIELRPLTSGELAKLQVIDKTGITMKIGMNQQGKRQAMQSNDIDVNAGELNKYQTEAMYKAVAWSMGIDEKAVRNFSVGIPEQIFEHVVRISNINEGDLTAIKQFRKNE